MGIYYRIIAETVTPEGTDTIQTFGIVAENRLNGGEVLSHFGDVSIDINVANRITGILNTYEVELCHFYDVVLDELNR